MLIDDIFENERRELDDECPEPCILLDKCDTLGVCSVVPIRVRIILRRSGTWLVALGPWICIAHD
jgi:hypothetical protein